MAKKKIKKARKPRRKLPNLEPSWTVPPTPLVEVVLVPVPVEKTKQSEWHKWVDWIWK